MISDRISDKIIFVTDYPLREEAVKDLASIFTEKFTIMSFWVTKCFLDEANVSFKIKFN